MMRNDTSDCGAACLGTICKYSDRISSCVLRVATGRTPISFCDRVYEMREGRLYESDLASDQKVFPAE